MSISDGFAETNNLWRKEIILGENPRVGRNKQEMRAHAWFGNLEYMIQMALASDFSTCGCQIRNLKHGVCTTAICWAFSTRGNQNKNEKSLQSMLSLFLRKPNRNPSKQAVSVALESIPLLRGFEAFLLLLGWSPDIPIYYRLSTKWERFFSQFSMQWPMRLVIPRLWHSCSTLLWSKCSRRAVVGLRRCVRMV